jgi:hypothetical protein
MAATAREILLVCLTWVKDPLSVVACDTPNLSYRRETWPWTDCRMRVSARDGSRYSAHRFGSLYVAKQKFASLSRGMTGCPKAPDAAHNVAVNMYSHKIGAETTTCCSLPLARIGHQIIEPFGDGRPQKTYLAAQDKIHGCFNDLNDRAQFTV